MDSISKIVKPNMLGIGEDVIVTTKMGSEVCRGAVKSSMFDTVVLNVGESMRAFSDRLYDFVVYETKQTPKKEDDLDEGAATSPMNNLEKQVDVETLPEDIKKKVTGISNLNDDQIDQILQAIGDAAVSTLRRIGLKETQLYSTADRIQQVVDKVLRNPTETDKKQEKEKSKSE